MQNPSGVPTYREERLQCLQEGGCEEGCLLFKRSDVDPQRCECGHLRKTHFGVVNYFNPVTGRLELPTTVTSSSSSASTRPPAVASRSIGRASFVPLPSSASGTGGTSAETHSRVGTVQLQQPGATHPRPVPAEEVDRELREGQVAAEMAQRYPRVTQSAGTVGVVKKVTFSMFLVVMHGEKLIPQGNTRAWAQHEEKGFVHKKDFVLYGGMRDLREQLYLHFPLLQELVRGISATDVVYRFVGKVREGGSSIVHSEFTNVNFPTLDQAVSVCNRSSSAGKKKLYIQLEGGGGQVAPAVAPAVPPLAVPTAVVSMVTPAPSPAPAYTNTTAPAAVAELPRLEEGDVDNFDVADFPDPLHHNQEVTDLTGEELPPLMEFYVGHPLNPAPPEVGNEAMHELNEVEFVENPDTFDVNWYANSRCQGCRLPGEEYELEFHASVEGASFLPQMFAVLEEMSLERMHRKAQVKLSTYGLTDTAVDAGGVLRHVSYQAVQEAFSSSAGPLKRSRFARTSSGHYLPEEFSVVQSDRSFWFLMGKFLYWLLVNRNWAVGLHPAVTKHLLDEEITSADLVGYSDYTDVALRCAEDNESRAHAGLITGQLTEAGVQVAELDLPLDPIERLAAKKNYLARVLLIQNRLTSLADLKAGFLQHSSVSLLRAAHLDSGYLHREFGGTAQSAADVLNNISGDVDRNNPVIRLFEQAVEKLKAPAEVVALFVWVNGNAQVPPARPITFSIYADPDAQKLPVSHTCFARVDLSAARYVHVDQETGNALEPLSDGLNRMVEDLRVCIANCPFMLLA